MKVGRYIARELDQLIGLTVTFADKSKDPIHHDGDTRTGVSGMSVSVGDWCGTAHVPSTDELNNSATGTTNDSTISSSRKNHPACRRHQAIVLRTQQNQQRRHTRGRSITPVHQKSIQESSVGAQRPPLYGKLHRATANKDSSTKTTAFNNGSSLSGHSSEGSLEVVECHTNGRSSGHVLMMQRDTVEIVLDNTTVAGGESSESFDTGSRMASFSRERILDTTSSSGVDESTSSSDLDPNYAASCSFSVKGAIQQPDSIHMHPSKQHAQTERMESAYTHDKVLPASLQNERARVIVVPVSPPFADRISPDMTSRVLLIHSPSSAFTPIDPPGSKAYNSEDIRSAPSTSPVSVLVVATPLINNADDGIKFSNDLSQKLPQVVRIPNLTSMPTVPGYCLIPSRIPPSVRNTVESVRCYDNTPVRIPDAHLTVEAGTAMARKSTTSSLASHRQDGGDARLCDGGSRSSGSGIKSVSFRHPVHMVIPLAHAYFAVGDFVDVVGGMHKNQTYRVVKVLDDLVQVGACMGMSHALYVSPDMLRPLDIQL